MTPNDPRIDVNKDLPLMANAGQIRARHYMFRLSCHLQEQFFHGQAVIFLTPVTQEKVRTIFNDSNYVRLPMVP